MQVTHRCQMTLTHGPDNKKVKVNALARVHAQPAATHHKLHSSMTLSKVIKTLSLNTRVLRMATPS